MSSTQREGIALEIVKRLVIYCCVGALVPFLFCGGDCFSTAGEAFETILFGTLACIILWEGNGRLANWLDEKVSWLDKPITRFAFGVVSTITYTVLSILGLLIAFNYLIYDFIPDNTSYFSGTIISSTIITTIITLFLHSRSFLFKWKEEAVNAEKLRNEQLNSQYLSLKNQLQPHFLFNSLSALTTLVHQDPDQATVFIQELSAMYRYILEYSQERVANLDKEVDFLKSYLFLMQIRFGNNLEIDIQVAPHSDYMIPPLTLQLLAENAIKHNEVSKANPLRLSVVVREESESLVISNPLQLRTIPRESTGVGLANIRNRYEMITDRKVEISQTDTEFIVSVPLISFSKG